MAQLDGTFDVGTTKEYLSLQRCSATFVLPELLLRLKGVEARCLHGGESVFPLLRKCPEVVHGTGDDLKRLAIF